MAIPISPESMRKCGMCREWWDPLRLKSIKAVGNFEGLALYQDMCPRCRPELFGGKKWPVDFHE